MLLEQDARVMARKGQKASNMLALLRESNDVASAAKSLATYIIRQIFECYPSPTGKYGSIPFGRE